MSICLPGLTPAHAADGAPGATGNTVTQTTGSATTRDSAISVTGGTGGTGGDATPTLTFNSSATNAANVLTPSTGGIGGRGGTGNAAAASGAASGASSATVLATGGTGGTGGIGGAGIAVSGTGTVFTNQGIIFGGVGGVGGDGGGAAGAATSIVTDPAGNATAVVTARNGAGGTGGTGGAGIALSSNGIVLNNANIVIGGAGGTGGQPGPMAMAGPPASASANTSNPPSASASSGTGLAAATAASAQNAGPVTAAAAAGIGSRNFAIGFNSAVNNAMTGGIAQGVVAGTGGNGGDGGTGGAGVLATARNIQVVNTSVIIGGTGGAGRAGDPSGASSSVNGKTAGGNPNNGGNGGTGGAGILFTQGGAALTNSGVIVGGNGGAAGGGGGNGGAAGTGGAGGVGVVANGIQINNTGVIVGGFGNGGQAFAIAFTGGNNFVGGNGTIVGGIDVQGGASFQPALPGSPLGVPLAITGPLQFARTATYQIRLNTTTSDLAVATGNATLNGARVFAQSPDGVAAPPRFMRYTILTATGGIVGTFNPIVGSNLAFFKPTLAYDANNVYLDAAYNYVITGGTQNQIAVGSGLNNVAYGPLSGAGNQIFNALNKVQQGQAGAVLDSLSGEGITASQNIAFRSAQLFNSAIFDQTTFYSGGGAANSITLGAPQPGFTALATPEQTLAAANSGQKVRELADLPNRRVEPALPAALQRTWRAWGSGFGGVENIQGNGQIGSANQNNSIIGGAIGVDYQLLPNYLLGVAVGGTDGSFRVPGRATSGSTSGGHVAFYDIATFGKFYGASSTSFSYFGNRTTRVTGGFGGLATETQRGDFNSHEFRSRLEFGRHLDGPGLGALGVLTPFVALELAQLRSNGFNERAIAGPGLLGLAVQGQSIASVPSFVGFRLQRVTPLGNGMIFSPTLQVAWVHEFAPFRNQTAQIANLPGSVFLVDGARPARDAAQVKAGGELTIGPRTAVFANFDGEFSGINQLYAGKGGLRYIW